MKSRLFGLAPLFALAVVLGCRGGEPVAGLPTVAIDSVRFLGTSVTGPRPVSELAAADFVAETAPRLRVRVHRFGSEPKHSLPSIENRIERIVALDHANELLAALDATEAAYAEVGDGAASDLATWTTADAGGSKLLEAPFALARDVTLSLRARPEAAAPQDLDWSFDLSNLGAGADGKPRLRATLVHQREVRKSEYLPVVHERQALVLRDAPVVDGAALLFLYVPGGADPSSYAILVEATSAPADDLASHRSDLEKSASEAKLAAERVAEGAGTDPIAALVTLFSDYRRGAIVRLALANDASITEDFALAADDAVIDKFCEKVAGTRKDAPPIRDLGLELECMTLRFIADEMSGTSMSPSLALIAMRHGGEAGRFAAALEDAATTAKSLAELEQRFIAQNRSFLEDRSPSSRVRAYEWLVDRGRAPEGFEPLAPLADRKKALRAAEDKETALEAAARDAVTGEGGAK